MVAAMLRYSSNNRGIIRKVLNALLAFADDPPFPFSPALCRVRASRIFWSYLPFLFTGFLCKSAR